MGMNSISIFGIVISILIIIVVLAIILNSKWFKVIINCFNKTEEQKQAIRFLIYGEKRSGMSAQEYDELVCKMYSYNAILEKAKAKFGLTDSDIVVHPCPEINSECVYITNYQKDSQALVCSLSENEYRSSKYRALLILFGRKALYVYQLSYHSDKTAEHGTGYEYAYENLHSFNVLVKELKDENGESLVTISMKYYVSKEDIRTYETMVYKVQQETVKKMVAIGTHLDSPELKQECKLHKDKAEILRYFKAHDNLPLAILDSEYESKVVAFSPSVDEGKVLMNIPTNDLELAHPIGFRSYADGRDALNVVGRDTIFRTSVPQYTWLYFGKEQLYIYISSVNMENSVKSQLTQEIFYKDIASIRSENVNIETEPGKTVYLPYYKITLYFAGTAISMTLPIKQGEDKPIQAMVNLLREKQVQSKNAVVTKDLI